MEHYSKRGYLDSGFKLFHLSDQGRQEFEYHYHEFDKVIIFLKGSVDYVIEGRSYALKPYDIVLVNHNEIHKPDINPDEIYERIIVYLSPDFITSYRTGEYDLSRCFTEARTERSNVLRVQALSSSLLFQTIRNLERACAKSGYANELYCQVLFLEFMIHLNRAALEQHLEYLHTDSCNEKIIGILNYINRNLTTDLNIDLLAEHFYMSRSHLMHLFKKETGYSIGNYINEKRLLLAKERLRFGVLSTEVCYDCGFKSYSAFSRAYKKLFGQTPSQSGRK